MQFKRSELARLDRVLDAVKPETLEDMDEEKRKNVEFLVWQKQNCLALPNWPFNLRAFLGAGFSTLVALWPVAAELAKKLLTP